MQKKSFSLGLMILSVAQMKNTPEFTKESREVWWQSLKDLNDIDFLHTCRELIKAESWFPSICDIREAVKHPKDPVLAAANRRLARLKEPEKKVLEIT